MGANRDISKLGPLPTTVGGGFVWTTAGWAQVTKANVGLANADNTADSAKPVSVAQQAALNERVSVAGDQLITGRKTLTQPIVVQNGAATGTLVLGADVNNNTITDNTRKLSRVVVPPRSGSLPNWTLLAGDTTDNAGVNEVYFGGAPASSIGGATSLHFFTAPTPAAGAGLRRFSLNSEGHLVSGNSGAYDIGASDARIRTIYSSTAEISGPIRMGQYTLSTLPSASAYSGYEIDVTNATGGSKRCRSNGTVWQILNTTTTVS